MTDDVRRQQLAENLRFYADMRFKQLTLLIGGLTLAGAGVAQYPNTQLMGSLDVRTALAVLALVFTAVMLIMEVRSTISWFTHRNAAPDLCPRPTEAWFRWVNATNAVLFLHLFIYAGWYWLGWHWFPHICFRLLFGALGGALVVYSFLNYSSLWRHQEGNSAGPAEALDRATEKRSGSGP